MALNIKNVQVERLATELARLTGETKTEAIRRALVERRERLVTRTGAAQRSMRLRRFLETEVWQRIPEEQVGRGPGKAERESILGYGRGGV